MNPIDHSLARAALPNVTLSSNSAITPELSQVVDALKEYIAALSEGRQINRQDFMSRHPGFPAALVGCLDGLEFIHVGSAGPGARAVPPRGMADESDLLAAKLGDYRIIRELGRGGMGVVFEAEQVSLGRRVALKILPFAAALDPRQQQRFKNEAHSAAQLHHPHIVPVYDFGCERGVHFYAMQLVDGPSLARVIRSLRHRDTGKDSETPSITGPPTIEDERADQPLPGAADVQAPSSLSASGDSSLSQYRVTSSSYCRVVAELGVQAAEALAHAHEQGVVHRDIKPANLLLDPHGALWVTDFGLAQCHTDAGLTLTGTLLGTLRYMSPEQALAKRIVVDNRTDIYSLGVTLYELLTLRPAITGDDRQEMLRQIAFEEPTPPRRINPAIPVDLETIILKAGAKNPDERYGTAQELADDLSAYLRDQPIRARPPTMMEKTAKWARRNQRLVVSGLVILLIAVVGLAVSTALIAHSGHLLKLQTKETQREKAQAVANWYGSLVREAAAIRGAQKPGYRSQAWRLIEDALKLDTPARDLDQLRREAVACMGDPAGLEPTKWDDLPSDLRALALDARGEQAALGLNDGVVLVRRLLQGETVCRYAAHDRPVTELRFGPAANQLVSADEGGAIRFWEVTPAGAARGLQSFQLPLAELPMKPSTVVVAFAVDDVEQRLYATTGAAVHCWSLADGKPVAMFPAVVARRLQCLALSPDRRTLIAGFAEASGKGGVARWQVGKPDAPPTVFAFSHAVLSAAFTAAGEMLFCACGEGGLLITNPEFSSAMSLTSAQPDRAFVTDNNLLVTFMSGTGVPTLWRVSMPQKVTSHLVTLGSDARPARRSANHAAGVSANGHVVAWGGGREVRFSGLADADEKRHLGTHPGPAAGVAFSTDSQLVASAGRDGSVTVWEAATGKLVRAFSPLTSPLEALAFTPRGRFLIVGDLAGQVQVLDVATGSVLGKLAHDLGGPIQSVVASPDGEQVAACGPQGGAIWNLAFATDAEGRVSIDLARSQQHRVFSGCQAIAFAPGGKLVASAMADGTLRLWDLSARREILFAALRLAGPPYSVTFSSNGRQLGILAASGRLERWNVADQTKAGELGQPADYLLDDRVSAWSPDGRCFASLAPSLALNIWDADQGKLLFPLPQELDAITCLAWSPDRNYLALGRTGGGILLWHFPRVREQLSKLGLE